MMTTTLTHALNQFEYYKSLAERAMIQVNDEALFWSPDEKSNSIGVIIKHLHGNMLSRWTDFLTSDGEKSWRNRDGEFVETKETRQELMAMWDEGWACLFHALKDLQPGDMDKMVYIRNMGQTVEDAVLRQLAHYAYHVGQIVYLARLENKGDWLSLTIPKAQSETYNKERFENPPSIRHFTEEK